MKKMSKILALVLAVMLMAALAVPALAQGDTESESSSSETVTITINNDTTNPGASSTEKYYAYKIFDATYAQNETTEAGAGDGAVSYTIDTDSPWYTAVSTITNTSGTKYFKLTDVAGSTTKKTVALNDGIENTASTAADIATALKAYLTDSAIDAAKIEIPQKADKSGYEVDEVTKGYYLISTTAGANLIIATTDVNMQEKNTYITDGKVAETASVAVGQDATYYVVVNIPANTDETVVTVHDEMAPQLSFKVDSVKFFKADDVTSYTPATPVDTLKGLTYTAIAATDPYQVKTTNLADTNCTFEIDITTADLKGKTVIFQYKATVTAADADGNGFVNKEYTSNGNYTTTPSNPKVYNFDFNLNKTFTNSTDTSLTATFNLKDSEGNVLGFTKSGTTYTVAAADAEGRVTDIEAANTVAVKIQGLAAGVYTLVETGTAPGYNPLVGELTVTITDTTDGETIASTVAVAAAENSGDSATATDRTVNVVNNSGTELPSTGGIGTTIFTVIGGVLVIGAVVLFVTKRRAGAAE